MLFRCMLHPLYPLQALDPNAERLVVVGGDEQTLRANADSSARKMSHSFPAAGEDPSLLARHRTIAFRVQCHRLAGRNIAILL